MGENGSELRLVEPGEVHATAKVAALLDETPNSDLQDRPYSDKPYWNIKRARIGQTREVPVELIINGYPVARQVILADGLLREVSFATRVEQSSWVAIRILPSSHTNPIFVLVGDKPIRASAKSADWCLQGVDKCWAQKERFIKADEMSGAKAAYEHARVSYRRLLAECQSAGPITPGAKPGQ
jgi:hypothetical protein